MGNVASKANRKRAWYLVVLRLRIRGGVVLEAPSLRLGNVPSSHRCCIWLNRNDFSGGTGCIVLPSLRSKYTYRIIVQKLLSDSCFAFENLLQCAMPVLAVKSLLIIAIRLDYYVVHARNTVLFSRTKWVSQKKPGIVAAWEARSGLQPPGKRRNIGQQPGHHKFLPPPLRTLQFTVCWRWLVYSYVCGPQTCEDTSYCSGNRQDDSYERSEA